MTSTVTRNRVLRPLLQLAGRRVVRVGWIAVDTLDSPGQRFSSLVPPGSMRISDPARWLNAASPVLHNEMYRPNRRYDVVVFVKSMDERFQEEASRIRDYGGKVVFDANVNYYEIWGEYDVPGTRPTAEQQHDALVMTSEADWVVADSSYLLGIVRKHNPRSSWIPDNVNLRVYRGVREHLRRPVTRLVWSGVAAKAQQLLSIADALGSISGIELVLVADEEPHAMRLLEDALPCRFVRFEERIYARTLLDCDVIISPKRLVNGYELGHTEYKITLGMAAGLPAVASPQQSYVEAIGAKGGGVVADGLAEWRDALEWLAHDAPARAELGARARETVVERYSTPVIAPMFGELFQSLG